jgi:paired amphipathic helix protein Sin3a
VYLQVQHLFKDAPDLLAEFKVFLGEVAGPQNGIVILPQPSGGSASPWLAPENPASSPAVASAKKPQSAKRKKRAMDKEPTPVPQTKPPPSRVSNLS